MLIVMCVSPIRIRHPTKKCFLDVPCGHCFECIQKRTYDLTFRLNEQMKISKNAYFFTLTYDNDNLPIVIYNEDNVKVDTIRNIDIDSIHSHLISNDTIEGWKIGPGFYKKDIQDLIHSLRDRTRYVCKKKKISVSSFKYFVSSEYGDNSHRPHYHGIVFGFPGSLEEFQSMLEKFWRKGFVSSSVCNERRVYYACKYALKNAYENYNFDRCFICLSKGMGIDFLSDAMIDFMTGGDIGKYNLVVTRNGKKRIIPKYYRDKVFIYPEQKEKLKDYFSSLKVDFLPLEHKLKVQALQNKIERIKRTKNEKL